MVLNRMLLRILSLGWLFHISHGESRGNASYVKIDAAAKATDQTSVTQALNAAITSNPGAGVYQGGKGVIFRNINDGLQGKTVVPTTFIVNDIFSANIAYPNGNPMCPSSGWDGFTKGNPCTSDPYLNAVVGVVMGSTQTLNKLFKDFGNIQKPDWGYGVFYATDSNAADHRCYWKEKNQGWECPGAWIDEKTMKVSLDSRQRGAGYYPAGNPNAGGGGGGAGCHWSSSGQNIDQYDSSAQPNLVGNFWCECNYDLKGHGWLDWVNQWLYKGVAKSKFQSKQGWFDGGKKKAPNWAVDEGICWVNNMIDMIEMQNMIWFKRWDWANQLMPQSSWNIQLPETQRYYWGWNEIPLNAADVDNAQNWDAIVIKLPVAICGGSGGNDVLDCMPVKAQEDLENQLAWHEQNGKLKVGEGNIGNRPGSYVVLLREYQQATNYWQRYFFCQSWVSARYSVNFKPQAGKFPGECWVDHGNGKQPSPPKCNGKAGAFMVNRDKSLCLDVTGGKFVDGAQMQIWACNGLPQQHFIWCDDNRIVSAVNSNMCLDVPGGAPGTSTYLQMWECNGRESQKWGYDAKDGQVYSTPEGETMCMDIAGGILKQGTRVNIYQCAAGSGETWALVSPPPPAPCNGQVGHFRPKRDLTKCLDIAGGKIYNGAPVQIWNCNGQKQQEFMWCADNRIMSAQNDNFCLDIPSAGQGIQPTYLQMWECNGHQNQLWGYDGNTLGIYPTIKGEAICMDLDSGSLNAGTRVNLYNCQPGNGEQWVVGWSAHHVGGSVNDTSRFIV